MRVGLFLAYWPWFSPREQIDLAVLADELGMDLVWIAEGWGQDVVSVLGIAAARDCQRGWLAGDQSGAAGATVRALGAGVAQSVA